MTAILSIEQKQRLYREGCGQTAIHPGGHHVSERFFNMQRLPGSDWVRRDPAGPGSIIPRLTVAARVHAGLHV